VNSEDMADLELLNKLFEAGQDQIRQTFDLYLELVNKFHDIEMGNNAKEQDNGTERDSRQSER